MKAVYAVLCALIYVCRAAPLTCDQLISAGQVQDVRDRGLTGDQGLRPVPLPVPHTCVQVSGRWYVHAMTTDSCVLRSTLHTLLSPSIVIDVTKETEQYQVVLTFKTMSFCDNDTVSLTPLKGLLSTNNGAETYKSLHSSCSDCLVVRTDVGDSTILSFFSRRTSVEPAEILEFETQASCVSLPQPQRFGTDYDFTNCKNVDGIPTEEEVALLQPRIEAWVEELIKCFVDYISSWF